MKKIIKSMAVLMAAAAALTACKAELTESLESMQGVSFSIEEMDDPVTDETSDLDEPETRTVFGNPSNKTIPVLWTAKQGVSVFAESSAVSSARDWSVVPSKDGKTAKLTGSAMNLSGFSNGYFVLLSPSASFASHTAGNTHAMITVPATQTPTATSPDEKAMILGAKTDTYASAPTTVKFTPKHMTAYLALKLTNSKVKGVQSVTVEFTAKGTTFPLVGGAKFDYSGTTPKITSASVSGNTTVTARVSSLTNVVWLAVLPAKVAGAFMKVTIAGTSGTETRSITVPSGKNLTPGTVATVTVDMNPSVAVTGVTLDKTSLDLNLGKSETLTATVTPSNASDKTVTWSSSNTAVATVSSDGVVTGVKAGTATITATTNDGGKTATCAVTVKAPAATKVEILSKRSTLYEDGMLHITSNHITTFNYRITYADGTLVDDNEGEVSIVSGTSVALQGKTFQIKAYPSSESSVSNCRTTIRVKSTRTPSVYDEIVVQTWANPTGVESLSTYSFENWLKEGTTQTYRAYRVLPAGARQKVKFGAPSNERWTLTQTGDISFTLKAPVVNGTTVADYQNQKTTVKISPWHITSSDVSLTQTFNVSNIEVREPKLFDFVAYNSNSKKNKVFDGGLRILLKTSTARDYQVKDFYCENVSLYVPQTGYKVVGIVTTTFSGKESDQPVTGVFKNTDELNRLIGPDESVINGNRIHGFAIAMYNAIASYWSKNQRSVELSSGGWWPVEVNAYNSTSNCCYLYYGNSNYTNMLQGYTLTACGAYYNGQITSSSYAIYPVDRVWRYGEPGIEYSLNVLPKSYPSATPTSGNACSFVMRPWFVPTITNWQNIMLNGKLYNTAVMNKINEQITKAGFGDQVFPYSTDRYWTINTVPGWNGDEPQAYEVYANGFGPQEKTTESGVRPFMIF